MTETIDVAATSTVTAATVTKKIETAASTTKTQTTMTSAVTVLVTGNETGIGIGRA